MFGGGHYFRKPPARRRQLVASRAAVAVGRQDLSVEDPLEGSACAVVFDSS
jgi:hypothetical protein